MVSCGIGGTPSVNDPSKTMLGTVSGCNCEASRSYSLSDDTAYLEAACIEWMITNCLTQFGKLPFISPF